MDKSIAQEMIERGAQPRDLLVDYTSSFFRYLYQAWKALEEDYGYAPASDLYRKFTWGSPECGDLFRQVVGTLDYKVEDLKTMGKASAAHYMGFPIPLDIVEDTEERVVQEAAFCPNPAFDWRPWDRPLDLLVYHHVDGWCGTCDLFFNYYKVAGLDDKLDFHMEGALCTGFPKCRFVLERKG